MISDKRSSVGFRNCTRKRRIKVFALLASLALLFVGNSTYGQFKYNPNALVPFDPAFKMGKLDNGIRYIIYSHSSEKGKAYFYAFFKVGSIQEEPNEYGAAHFIEHLYGDYPRQEIKIGNYLNSIGLNYASDINAATSQETTNYTLFNVPTQRETTLDSVLMILKTMPFHSVSSEEVDKQRKIVLEEWMKSTESDFSSTMNQITLNDSEQTLHETIGDTAVINHISAIRLKQLHDKWYRPDNLTVIAIGDFDASKMETRIKQIFSLVPKAEGEKAQARRLSDNKEPIIGITRCDHKVSSIRLSYRHDAQLYTQKRLRMEIVDKIIKTMFENRINYSLNNIHPVLNYCSTFYESGYSLLPSYDSYNIEIQLENNNLLYALNAVLAIKKQIEKQGFTNKELNQEKKERLKKYYQSNIQLPYYEHYIACYYYLLNGKIHPADAYYDQFEQSIIPQITLKEINERFREYTANIQPTINILVPNNKDFVLPTRNEVKTVMASVRTTCPYVPSAQIITLEDKTIHPGQIVKETHNKEMGTTEWTLSNGMRAIIKPTNFNSDRIIFMGFRKNLSVKLKNEYSYYNHVYGGDLCETMGFGNYPNAVLNQFVKKNHLVVDKQFAMFSGYSEQTSFKTCLQLIRLKYLQQRWNDTLYNDRIKQIKKEIKTPSGNDILDDTVMSYFAPRPIPQFMTLNQFKHFHQKIFGNPGDFTFIFAGNINLKIVKPWVEKYLASIPNNGNRIKNNAFDSIFYKTTIKKQTLRPSEKEIDCKCKYSANEHAAYIGVYCICPVDMDSIIEQKPEYILQKAEYRIVSAWFAAYLKNIIREKEYATYNVDRIFNLNTSNHSLLIGCYFQTDPKIAKQINETAKGTLRNFMEYGLTEKEFKFQKDNYLTNCAQSLKSNWWWVNVALYEYYKDNINIIPTFLSDVENITKEKLVKFTHQLYSQCNILNVLMLPE